MSSLKEAGDYRPVTVGGSARRRHEGWKTMMQSFAQEVKEADERRRKADAELRSRYHGAIIK